MSPVRNLRELAADPKHDRVIVSLSAAVTADKFTTRFSYNIKSLSAVSPEGLKYYGQGTSRLRIIVIDFLGI